MYACIYVRVTRSDCDEFLLAEVPVKYTLQPLVSDDELKVSSKLRGPFVKAFQINFDCWVFLPINFIGLQLFLSQMLP